MQTYEIRWGRIEDVPEIVEMAMNFHQAFINWKLSADGVKKIIKSVTGLLLIATQNGRSVGFNVGKIKTPGVCLDAHLFVYPDHRLRGVGGGLVISLLKALKKWKYQGQEFHKLYGQPPHYNPSVELYRAMKFPLEGIQRKHTRAKTDIWGFAFYLDEQEIPKHGAHLTKHTPYPIDDSEIIEINPFGTEPNEKGEKVEKKKKSLAEWLE